MPQDKYHGELLLSEAASLGHEEATKHLAEYRMRKAQSLGFTQALLLMS